MEIRKLDGMEQWMLDRNIEAIQGEGTESVVLRLRQQGYGRVADALVSHATAVQQRLEHALRP